jgi:hypothetical protein
LRAGEFQLALGINQQIIQVPDGRRQTHLVERNIYPQAGIVVGNGI